MLCRLILQCSTPKRAKRMMLARMTWTKILPIFAIVQLLSHVWLFATPCSILGFPVLHHLQEFAQTHINWVGDATQPSHPLLPLLLLPSVSPRIRVFPNELALRSRWTKYWSFSQQRRGNQPGVHCFPMQAMPHLSWKLLMIERILPLIPF